MGKKTYFTTRAIQLTSYIDKLPPVITYFFRGSISIAAPFRIMKTPRFRTVIVVILYDRAKFHSVDAINDTMDEFLIRIEIGVFRTAHAE